MICLAAALLGIAASVFIVVRNGAVDRLGLEQSPEVLSQKAREIIGHLGYEGRPVDSASGFFEDSDFSDYVEKNDKPHPQWNQILAARPSLMEFWYRQSPQYMAAKEFRDMLLTTGVVSENDPAPILSGMINVRLDPKGRLTYFEAIPPQVVAASAPTTAFDWNVLFAAAGLDPSQYQSAAPSWNSLAASDARAAWTGKWPGSLRPMRIEAAAWQGKPVFFSLIGDWNHPNRMKPPEQSVGRKASEAILLFLLIAMSVGASLLARRHYRQGRGNRDGAFRLARLVFGLLMLLWLLRTHLTLSLETVALLVLSVSTALFVSGMIWLLYLALEPYVRRYQPHSIISWSRLLTGHIRDPLVGRDILFGVVLGVVWILIFELRYLVMMRMGASPLLFTTDYLSGTRQAFGVWLYQIPVSVLGTLQFVVVLLGLKTVLKKDWLAGAAFVALFVTVKALSSSYPAVELPAQILVYSIAALVVLRFGLVPLACGIFTTDMLVNVPFGADLSAWYMSTSIFALLSVAALAAWAFYTSLGDEPLWKPDL